MNKINERYWLRAKVVHHDPMTNPENGWVQGFYYQDLCEGKIKHFIRSGEMIWEIDPKTLGMFTGFYDCSTEPQPIFEGDVLHTLFKDNSSSNADALALWMKWTIMPEWKVRKITSLTMPLNGCTRMRQNTSWQATSMRTQN